MELDPNRYIRALRASHNRLSALVEALSPQGVEQQSYDTDWTIANVLSHLGSGAEIGIGWVDAAVARTEAPGRETMAPIWERWNAMSPQEQARDALTWDERHVARFEGLTEDELAQMHINLFGIMDLDAAGLVRVRLSEHAIHTWDVAVALDPSALVSPDAVALLIDTLEALPGRSYRTEGGDPQRVHVVTTDPAREFLLTLGADPSLRPWEDGATDATLRLPAEAFVRLVYGRLDAGHTPALDAESAQTLDSIRAGFKGF
jgi:uncharacterized protein (TIGR03083 family)